VTQQTDRLNAALAGRYRIERHLGEGGMASVYLAEDLRHKRQVALKLLKPELAAVLGADRFVQEITTTAGLQHPHILPLFDSGTADGFLFYVMPFIKGETLREKLNRETQLGVDEALRIAREVLDALEYAHQHGIVHRDVKPENILLHGGHAMVADFGIALAVSAAAGGRMTETGLSLGTPHYMSPEQATAEKEITPRSDIYSLASVLYEMLAGVPPHEGGSAQQTIMRIIADTARPIRELRKNVPRNVDDALAKALEKLPADRFDSARAFSDALDEAHFTYGTATAARAGDGARASAARTRAALVGATTLALVGLAAAWAWRQGSSKASAPVVPLVLNLPNANPDLGRFAVSSDGDRFAFSTDEGIVVRDAGQREYRLMTGTESGESPTFSPDGEWIAFHIRGHLRKIAVAGGAPLALIPGDTLSSGRINWGHDGSIVFQRGEQMVLIPAKGGPPRLLAKARSANAPRLMPDGTGVLYVDLTSGAKLMYYDLAADTIFTILEGSSEAQYLPSGHIIYAAEAGGLFAVRFDPRRHAVSGTPVPIVSDLQPNGGVAPFTVTTSGTLIYRAGVDRESRLLMRHPGGKVDTLSIAPRILSYVRFSPDGRALALTIGSARGTNRHTALYDLALGSVTRFTELGGGHSPVWSPDGTRLAFTAEGEGSDAEDVYVQPVDRSAKPVRVLRLPNDQHSSDWPVDTMLVFSSQSAPQTLGGSGLGGGGTAASVAIVNPASPGQTRDYLKAQWGQLDAVVSPDGQWAAFTSLESGSAEVYVRSFPRADAAGMWKVSAAGGSRPRWSGDGRTIYYHAMDGKTIRAVHVTPGPKFGIGATEVVMTVPDLGNAWDVDRRTGRIVVAQGVASAPPQIVVIQHWLDEFRRRQAVKR
jgi:serine/threonine-protein kinase